MLAVPVYNQLNDPLPDGQQDPQAANDCGSECVAMIGDAFGYGGAPGFPAGDIRVIIRRGDLTGPALTNGDDLVYGLSACFQIPSHVRAVNAHIAQLEVQRAVDAGMPPIVLGRWDGTALHWVVGVGRDATGLTVNDPWGGTQRVIAWADFQKLYAGQYVHVDRKLT